MAMFEKAEDEYNDLISKKNIIEVGGLLFSVKFIFGPFTLDGFWNFDHETLSCAFWFQI